MKARGQIQRIAFGLLLVLLSIFFYTAHFVIFRDAHHIFIYLLGDVAFVFIEVLLVTLIIHQLLNERERRSMLKKLNMVIGAFFSEVGTPLLTYFSLFDTNTDRISKHLIVNNDWSSEQFSKIRAVLENRDYQINVKDNNLKELQKFIVDKRAFLLRLLENPNLLEHENFTELLWAVFHLAEELSHRKKVRNLTGGDYEHLGGDIKRAYEILIREWLAHMEHLKNDYPYLFSLAMRTNPFDPEASVELK
jgi:hypothetical protein